jgi:hypothetical protein
MDMPTNTFWSVTNVLPPPASVNKLVVHLVESKKPGAARGLEVGQKNGYTTPYHTPSVVCGYGDAVLPVRPVILHPGPGPERLARRASDCFRVPSPAQAKARVRNCATQLPSIHHCVSCHETGKELIEMSLLSIISRRSLTAG